VVVEAVRRQRGGAERAGWLAPKIVPVQRDVQHTGGDVDAGEIGDAGGQPGGERSAAGGNAQENDGWCVAGAERGALDHLVRHTGDSARDIAGRQQLTPLGRVRRAAMGRRQRWTSFPASLDGSLKDV
jgi:hypothetical protein